MNEIESPDKSETLMFQHLSRLKQNLIDEKNFISKQFEEQLSLLKLRFKLEIHSFQTDFELNQFQFRNRAEELFYKYKTKDTIIPAYLVNSNDMIEEDSNLLIEKLNIDKDLVNYNPYLDEPFKLEPENFKQVKEKINENVKNIIKSLNIKISDNENFISNLTKSLVNIASDIYLDQNAEAKIEQNNKTTAENLDKQPVEKFESETFERYKTTPMEVVKVPNLKTRSSKKINTSQARSTVLQITTMLNSESEDNSSIVLRSDSSYSSDDSKGKSKIDEEDEGEDDHDLRDNLDQKSVSFSPPALDIKPEEIGSHDTVRKLKGERNKWQKDKELQEIQSIIPKNLKKKSRKDPKKYNSINILNKDPLNLRVCPVCERKFYRAEHLKRHLTSVHNSEKPFTCDHCNKNFTRKDNLNQHQKRKHPDL